MIRDSLRVLSCVCNWQADIWSTLSRLARDIIRTHSSDSRHALLRDDTASWESMVPKDWGRVTSAGPTYFYYRYHAER